MRRRFRRLIAVFTRRMPWERDPLLRVADARLRVLEDRAERVLTAERAANARRVVRESGRG